MGPGESGASGIIRFADDFLLLFERETDARRVQAVLPKRLGRFGLELNTEKTRLVHFHPPRQGGPGGPQWIHPEVFQFLGFTHYWGRSRRGRWVVKRRTAGNRLSRALRAIAEWCRRHRHESVRKQHRQLSRKLVGHYNYYGITGNGDRLGQYRYEVGRIWRKWVGSPNAPRHDAVEAIQSAGGALPAPGREGPSLHLCSEAVFLRNRMREICTSGSVGELVG